MTLKSKTDETGYASDNDEWKPALEALYPAKRSSRMESIDASVLIEDAALDVCIQLLMTNSSVSREDLGRAFRARCNQVRLKSYCHSRASSVGKSLATWIESLGAKVLDEQNKPSGSGMERNAAEVRMVCL